MTGRRVRRPPGYWDEVEPVRAPSPNSSHAAGIQAPTRSDPVARAASTVAGGPGGRRLASATGFWRALPVLMLLSAVLMGGAVVEKEHCRAQGWSSPDQFWHACYSDIPVLFQSGSLGEDARPGLEQSLGPDGLGLPPVTGAVMWIVSGFIPESADAPREFFDLSAILLYLALAVGVYACVLISGRRGRPWDAAHLALSPVLITSALISYQLFAVTLLVLAILAWTRERPALAGFWLGLAVAAGPVLSVVALALLAIGVFIRRMHPALVSLGTAVLTWWLLRVLLLPGLFGGIRTAWHSWTQSQPGYGSTWLIPQLLEGSAPDRTAHSVAGRVALLLFGWLFKAQPLDGSAASALALLSLIVLVPPIIWFSFGGGFHETAYPRRLGLGMLVPERLAGERILAPLALALLAAGLLTVKSLPVQTSLLLLPLIALSGLCWRDHLIWAVTELVYFVGVWLYIAADSDPNRGLPDQFYLIMLVARLAAIAWVGLQGVLISRRRVLRAHADQPVAADDADAGFRPQARA
jgi:hypothetical protein